MSTSRQNSALRTCFSPHAGLINVLFFKWSDFDLKGTAVQGQACFYLACEIVEIETRHDRMNTRRLRLVARTVNDAILAEVPLLREGNFTGKHWYAGEAPGWRRAVGTTARRVTILWSLGSKICYQLDWSDRCVAVLCIDRSLSGSVRSRDETAQDPVREVPCCLSLAGPLGFHNVGAALIMYLCLQRVPSFWRHARNKQSGQFVCHVTEALGPPHRLLDIIVDVCMETCLDLKA